MRAHGIPPVPSSSSPSLDGPALSAVEIVLRQARRLHRAATSERLANAMPALRRLQAAGVFPGEDLMSLYRRRQALQRKHFLRLLALEAGFPDWERFRPTLAQMPPEAFDHFKFGNELAGSLNAWFSNEAQAQAYAQRHGGRVIRVGHQAVVTGSDEGPSAPGAAGDTGAEAMARGARP